MNQLCFLAAVQQISPQQTFVLVVWNRFPLRAAQLLRSTPASRSPLVNSALERFSLPHPLSSTGSSLTRRWASSSSCDPCCVWPSSCFSKCLCKDDLRVRRRHSWKNKSTSYKILKLLLLLFFCPADGSGVHTCSSHGGWRERWKVSSARRKRFRWIHRAGEANIQ